MTRFAAKERLWRGRSVASGVLLGFCLVPSTNTLSGLEARLRHWLRRWRRKHDLNFLIALAALILAVIVFVFASR